jgi:TIR domain
MSQGIFISYRRDDTRLIAGRLYEALKAAFPKKKIFFDVDTPEPGNEIIAKIVRELQSSQVVIALIGPQWNARNRLDSTHDFVRRELKSALDLRQQDGLKVLPVLVDGAKIPSERLPHDLIAIGELEYLEIAGDADVDRVVEGARRLLPPYWVGSHDDIVRWRWDWVDFLKHLIKLDVDEVPTIDAAPRHPLYRLRQGVHRCLERLGLRSEDPGDEGTPEQWAVIFEHHPQTWRMVLDKNDDIVAYWHVAPLKAEDYGKLVAGRFKAGMVTYDRLTLFENKGGHYNLFFVITVVNNAHRNAALYRQLFFSFFDVLEKLAAAEPPVFVTEVAADVWTPEGIKLAEGFGMKRVSRRADDAKILIYTVAVSDVLNDAIAKKRFRGLRERYAEAGFVLDRPSGAIRDARSA